jgi:hypothetical protein
MEYVHHRPNSPEGREAQLQAIALITAGLDSTELLQQEMTAAIGPKPDARSWMLLTMALANVGVQMTALAADVDSQNVEVVSGVREQMTPNELLQNWAALIISHDSSGDE